MTSNIGSAHGFKDPLMCVKSEIPNEQGMLTPIGSIHEGKKSFKCVNCNSSFVHKQHLSGHIGSVHKGKVFYVIYILKSIIS